MTHHHEEVTKKTIYTTRGATEANYDQCLKELESIRQNTLGGKGMIYRKPKNGRIFDSISGDWKDGPGWELYLMEIL